MGTVNLPPIQSRGNKSTDEYLRYIAESLAILQEESQNVLEGRLSSANIRELTADKIITGTLLAQLVTIMSNLNGGAYIRIDGNGMVINDGSKDVFSVDITGLVTMTGAVVQSTAGYPKVVMDPNGNLLGIYSDANNYIAFNPNQGGVPAIAFFSGGVIRGLISENGGKITFSSVGSEQIEIFPGGNLELGSSLGNVRIRSNGSINFAPSGPLQIDGINGYSGSISYVKSVVSDGMGGVSTTYGSINVWKGIVIGAT